MRRLRVGLLICLAAVVVGASAPGSELSQAVQKANHLIVLNELGVTTDQIGKLAPLSDRLVQAVQARNSERQRLLTEAGPTLEAARKALVEGAALPQVTETALAKLEGALKANDDTLEDTAVTVMADIEKEFFPQQNRYVDWTPPRRPVRPSAQTLAQRAQRERQQAALILSTVGQLERIRTYPLERYVLEAQKVVDDFLRPLIDPRSEDYPAARQFMFKVVEQVRLMPEEEWQERREEMAELLVGELGLLDEPEAAAQPKPYNWQAMYAIFSDLGAPELLRDMKRARATAVEEAAEQ
ncbi:MAG: hypothetical protein FJX74_13440 [Armatimonadetes bacterium]|nr:hypothetical protein [Armatimonadota bacterium]